jgi:hypothetical protein
MKIVIKILLSAMFLVPVYSFGQFTTTKIPTQSSKIGSTSNLSKLATTSKLDPKALENKTLESYISNTIPAIPSKEELERNRIKRWEITPSRPVTTGMDVRTYGTYSKNHFGITPFVYGNLGRFIPISNYISTNMAVGKDYKLTLNIKNFVVSSRAFILFEIGAEKGLEVEVKQGQTEVVLFFTNNTSAPQIIGFSPIIYNFVGTEAPTMYDLTSIMLEELAPAQ